MSSAEYLKLITVFFFCFCGSRDESVTKAAVAALGDLADVVGDKTKPLFSNFTFCGEFLNECLDSEDEDLKDTARWTQGMIARLMVA